MEPENINISFSFVEHQKNRSPMDPVTSMWMQSWATVLKETSQDIPEYELDVVLMDDGIAGGTIEMLGDDNCTGISTEILQNSPAILWMQTNQGKIDPDKTYHLVLRFKAWPKANPTPDPLSLDIRINLLKETFTEVSMEEALAILVKYDEETAGEVHQDHSAD